jgi:hypothetical protein
MILMESKAEQIRKIHFDLAKLLELGMSAEWIEKMNLSPDEILGFVKGMLYLKERYGEREANCYQ